MIEIRHDVSAAFLAKELETAQRALGETQRREEEHQRRLESQDEVDSNEGARFEPKVVQLSKLSHTADSLALAQSISEWTRLAPAATVDDPPQDEFGAAPTPSGMVIAEAEWCEQLAQIILEHSNLLELGGESILSETYVPLYEYLHSSLLNLLRNELEAASYPKRKESSRTLTLECQNSPETSAFGQACRWLIVLENSHRKVMETIEGRAANNEVSSMVVIRELLRPIVKRVGYHFVQASEDRVTSTRIDRLPEWLFTYLREKIVGVGDGDSPNDLIRLGLSNILSPDDTSNLERCFWNELMELVQWVLREREFFRNPEIAGQQSINPSLLYNAIEQFLLFDRSLRESVAPGTDDENGDVLGLMDRLVMADEELRQWWIERERESVFATLFEDDSMANVPKPLANHISPRAEIFCALIRSVQWKASTLTSPGIYLREVAVPLCSQFVEALHETSTDLRNLMCQPDPRGFSPATSTDLVANIHEWIEIINGTCLASKVLLKDGAWHDGMPATSQSDHDLARFGRSLERLVEVLVEEFAASFVETILMENAKFASYLMMGSHLLCSQEWEGDDPDLSVELQDTRGVLREFLQICNAILSIGEDSDEDEQQGLSDDAVAHFAPRRIRAQVMDRVADKFLEIVLDVHDVTPDIWQKGARIFARDVNVILAGCSDLAPVQRLLDVTRLLVMESGSMNGLFAALGGLVGATDFLDVNDFTADGTIHDEAVSMLKAKGFQFLELSDASSVLNRRRD